MSDALQISQGSTYTCPVDGVYSLYAKSGAAGNTANFYVKGIPILGNQNTNAITVPIYLRKGTELQTRAESGSTYYYWIQSIIQIK